ncbi:HAMP domain-containing methyl-accepting chemotaxis protein [Paenibacillus thalictri]|uniref:Methyl-accepting chemotaxis protein n=1 Tax=Paenibacillus thalictri TaxID=2527873 RepID=A0A4Q9DKC7_9BACL|nr:methyl-accepting chemotaxis protein [Paenibacillus thalictri]TBL71194.1 methyl-accepting chemotaxis protein [Paenibacillus thalictri]
MRLSVSQKMIASFSFIFLLLLISGLFSFKSMNNIFGSVSSITDEYLPGVELVNNLNFQTEHVIALTYSHLIENNADNMKNIEKEITDYSAKIDQTLKEYEPTVSTEDEKKHYDSLIAKWKEFQKTNAATLQVSLTNDQTKIKTAMADSYKAFSAMQTDLDALVKHNHSGALDAAQSVRDVYTSSTRVMVVIVILSLVFAIAITYTLHRLISVPIRKVTNTVLKVADGDLSVRDIQVKNRDEIGQLAQAVNAMVLNLRSTVQTAMDTSQQVAALSAELTASAEQTSRASEQIAASIDEVAAGSHEQLTGLDETARTMEEMTIGVERISEKATNVAEQTVETTQNVSRGNESMQAMLQQMGSIQSSTEQTSEAIHRLGERSDQIGSIVAIITEIANQTNLLALNASIEAARAGEEGRGFAVVALEVKKLAEQSGQSASQISALIEDIERDISRAKSSMELAAADVLNGTDAAKHTGALFEQILKSIEQVSEQFLEVSSTTQQMSASTEEISSTVVSIAAIAKQSSDNTMNVASASEEQMAAMEQISSTSAHLAQLADELQSSIRRFKLV